MDRQLRIEDVAAVQSRVSWGAIVGGSLVALTVYLLLGLLLGGIGLALAGSGMRENGVTWYAAITGIVSLVIAMFCGGCVTSQLTAGETRKETLIHGTLTWALVTAVTIWMVMMGARAGFNALLGVAVFASNESSMTWDQMARDAGISQSQIDQMKQSANNNPTPPTPPLVKDVRQDMMLATWATFIGAVLGIGAAILGALYGSGPTLRMFRVAPAIVEQTEAVTPQT
jgi:hypothetical protein